MEINLDTLVKYKDDGWLLSQNHPTLPLIIWNYSQTTQYENYWDEITLSCRGLVTDNEGNIVAKPFDKFFNIEEGKFEPTEKFEVYEKMDGSLGIVFWYQGQWVVATRGSFTSDQAIKAREILRKYNTDIMFRHLTFCFEIIYPENRIVLDYGNDEKLVLLGTFDKNGKEVDSSIWSQWGFDVVKKYDGINDYKELKQMIKNDQEGFVVKFSNGDRIKVKGVEYLRLHKIMTNVTTTGVWEYLKNGEDVMELLKDVPDEFYNKIKSYVKDLRYAYFQISEDAGKKFDYMMYGKYNDKEPIEDRKEFAEWVLTQPKHLSGILFRMFDKKDYSEIIWNLIRPEFKKL
jgi:RNA ligase